MPFESGRVSTRLKLQNRFSAMSDEQPTEPTERTFQVVPQQSG